MKKSNLTSLEQLKRPLDRGFIGEATYKAAVAGISAQLEGGGAIAQGPKAKAVGERGVSVEGDHHGISIRA